MRILVPGKKIKTLRVYRGECPYCDCYFECDDNDFSIRNRDLDPAGLVTCPSCGKEIMMKSSNHVRKELVCYEN